MNIEFRFAAVPFEDEGHICRLFKENTEHFRDTSRHLKNVVPFRLRGMKCLVQTRLFLSKTEAQHANKILHGTLFDLIGNGEEPRYILLGLRREKFHAFQKQLSQFVHEHAGDWRIYARLTCLATNIEACVAVHNERAALLIY